MFASTKQTQDNRTRDLPSTSKLNLVLSIHYGTWVPSESLGCSGLAPLTVPLGRAGWVVGQAEVSSPQLPLPTCQQNITTARQFAALPFGWAIMGCFLCLTSFHTLCELLLGSWITHLQELCLHLDSFLEQHDQQQHADLLQIFAALIGWGWIFPTFLWSTDWSSWSPFKPVLSQLAFIRTLLLLLQLLLGGDFSSLRETFLLAVPSVHQSLCLESWDPGYISACHDHWTGPTFPQWFKHLAC